MKKGTTMWLMGLSASGKSTLANKLMVDLKDKGKKVQLIDGDIMREDIGGMFGYTREDRINVARIYRAMARLLNDNGINVVIAAIAPYEEIRIKNRERLENYIEISLRCSIEECIKRDPKGLYKKALEGKEKFVIGIDEDYELPINSDLEIVTDDKSTEESYLILKEYIEKEFSL